MDPSLLVGLLMMFIEIPSVQLPQETGAPIIKEIDTRAERIQVYFEERGMPLSIYGKEFVEASDKYGIDWRLLPAIAIRESSGGKQMCGNNPFGWGSCSLDFPSIEEGIDKVAWNLGGHNPNTSAYYSGDTYDKLWSFNGTVMASYPDEVIAIMEKIGTLDKTEERE